MRAEIGEEIQKVMISSLSTGGVRGILLDIEGTTTPIAFVHEVLFSYARSRVREYLSEHFDSAELHEDLERLREEQAVDLKQNLKPPPLADGSRDATIDSFVAYINWLMDKDRKSPGLKSLQGKIWREGYLDGSLRAQLFPDVAPALERWHAAGVTISIFSSGSTLAQQLLFAHTEAGNLSKFITKYFDTAVGAKTDVESYRQIAASLSLPATDVLFISDVVAELDAAKRAGMETFLAVRPGNRPQGSPERYRTVESFKEI